MDRPHAVCNRSTPASMNEQDVSYGLWLSVHRKREVGQATRAAVTFHDGRGINQNGRAARLSKLIEPENVVLDGTGKR